ncbi:MAG: ZIP family metal transporter [Clostridia bacterium]|nr:ZIP family metal transporter [Clostridia bacterium]
MQLVLITALGVGGATIIGAVLGFIFKKISHKFSDLVLSFAAGIMLAAAVIGLILPSLEYSEGNPWSVLVTVVGILIGAVCLNLMDKLVPHLHRLSGVEYEGHAEKNDQLGKILLFVLAIAIHNIPEGIAAGVGFGTGNNGEALTIAAGIALQNIPEGMIIIAPMLAAGMSKGRTFIIAVMTGVVEVIGTFIGYYAVTVAEAILPFALAFAGGTMLYVISDEMIPETHHGGSERGATYALLVGFSVMLVMSFFLE